MKTTQKMKKIVEIFLFFVIVIERIDLLIFSACPGALNPMALLVKGKEQCHV